MKLLEFHWEVQPEIDSSYRWYERQQYGLGTQFLDAVEDALAEIADHPTRYGFADGIVRHYVFARFPHAIYYRDLPDRVRVLAVYHAARDPDGWKWRM
jgi:plasmid stabilization system protein ParE